MRHLFISALVFLCSAMVCAGAKGDTLATALGQPLREVSHWVDARIEDGIVTYKVRRSFANPGSKHDEASLSINLPFGAVATGLRIRSGKIWHKGELMERERAGELYKELTGIGPHAPKDPALLQWVWADRLHLQVFPVPPGKTATVEYTLTVSTNYINGKYHVSYPMGSDKENLTAPVITIFPPNMNSTILINGKLAAAKQPVILSTEEGLALCDDSEADQGDTCVVSDLVVEEKCKVSEISIDLDISHTYRSDLSVELLSPWGERYGVFLNEGGGENDIKKIFSIKFGDKKQINGKWQMVVSDKTGLDVGTINSWLIEYGNKSKKSVTSDDTPLFIPDALGENPNGHATIEITPSRIPTLLGRMGRVVASKAKQFLRLEIDMAPKLSEIPKGLSVVFVVDASGSMGREGVMAQLKTARAFLSHSEDAKFEVVLYRRFARRLIGEFIPADQFAAILKKAIGDESLKCKNGSALDQGLGLAAAALKKRKGPQYIVSFSDNLLRPAWKNRLGLNELAMVSKDTIHHLVIPIHDGPMDQYRDDEHQLAILAQKHGGILSVISGILSGDVKNLNKIVLGLVRPIQIDYFKIKGLKSSEFEPPDILEEGDGIRHMEQMNKAPRTLILTGKIWSKNFRRIIKVTPKFAKATAGFIFSHDLCDDLTEDEMMKVAMYGKAVSPVTSYLAIEPGVRPSTEGLEEMVRRRGAGAMGGGGMGMGAGRLKSEAKDIEAAVKPGILRCVEKYKPSSDWSASITIETTYVEIVDVILKEKQTPLTKCIVEEIWDVELNSSFSQKRESFQLQLPLK